LTRLLQGPDDAVRLWWRLTAREETASGRDPFLIKGSVPADRCVACGNGQHHEVPAKRGHGWVDRCQRCGAVWDSSMEYVPRGAVQATRRPHGLERRLVNLGDIEFCIDRIPRRDALPYGLYLVTDRSYEFVAHRANAAVARCRAALRSALEARSLLSRQIPVLLRAGGREVLEAVEPLPVEVLVPADPLRWSGLLQLAADGFQPDALESRGCSRLLAVAIDRAAPLADRVWTASELGLAWHVSVSTVRGWIDDGDLAVFNVGRGSVPHWRIDNAEALRFAEARRKRPGGVS